LYASVSDPEGVKGGISLLPPKKIKPWIPHWYAPFFGKR